MPAERHAWIHDSHEQNPFAHSLVRPLTIVASRNVDVPLKAFGQPEPTDTLACSRHEFTFPYLNYRREPRLGRAVLVLPPSVENRPKPRSVPLMLSIHYEGDVGWMSRFLGEGWACVTPTALPEDHGFNLAGDGMDHTLALCRLVRRLPWVDLQRIGWSGGSAGGYQCLIALGSLWPVACAQANVPVSDLYYDLSYLTHAGRYNQGITDVAAQPIPIVQAVHPITTKSREMLGDDVDAYWRNSAPPVAALMRSPMLIHSSTADLLCPVNQIGDAFVREPKRGDFPPGWDMSYRRFCNPNSLEKPLIEWFSRPEVEQFTLAIPDSTAHIDFLAVPEGAPPKPPPNVLRLMEPYSRDRLVSIVIRDEGAPDPMCSHTKYHVETDALPFFKHHFARGRVPAEHLTPPVLQRVLGRFSREVPQNPTLPPIRRTFDEFDRWEALLALETYLGPREVNAGALALAYSEMPPTARALDIEQDDVHAEFGENPAAGLLYHQAVELRKNGEERTAKRLEDRLARRHAGSAWAKLQTHE